MENKLKVGITHGDVNGIGYEVIIKMMVENKICEVCAPILYGSPKVAAYHRKNLTVENFSLNSINTPNEANLKRCNIVHCVEDTIKVEVGKETPESDEAAMIALKKALDNLDKKELDVVVAAPQGCASFKSEGAAGCLDFLAKRYEAKSVMPILVGEKMKVGFVTTHIPFKEITANITVNTILEKLKLLNNSLKRDFTIRKPRIAVLGLNPHAGDGYLWGEEEKNIIMPALDKARENGIMALGPYSADILFSGIDYTKFDAVLAMYHEQGMIPFKTIEGYTGAVYVAGLPIVYTSTVHGMAYDIVGQNVAEDDAIRNAIYVAIDIFDRQKQNAELQKNQLPHYNIGGNNNESDLNVEQIAGVKRDIED